MARGFCKDENGYYFIRDYTKVMEDFFDTYTVVYCEQKSLYYLYDDGTGIYSEWTEFLQKQTIKGYLEVINPKMWSPTLERHLIAAFPGHVTSVSEMNCRNNILTLNNGVLNLRNMKLESFSEENLSTWRLNIDYDPQAMCPRYDQFISEVSCGDEEMMLTLTELMGYVLSDSIKAHKLFIFCGEGANGKSVFCDLLNEMIAEENVANIPISELNQKAFARHYIAEKKIDIIYENDTQMKLSQLFTGTVKSIVSGDKLNAEIKGGANYSFRPCIKLILATNKLPKIDSIPQMAVRRRYLIIPFRAYFSPEVADKNLLAKLEKEKSGILNQALIGLRRLVKQGYMFTYQQKSDDYLSHMVEEAFPVVGFVNEKLVADSKGKVMYAELREAYADYCTERDIYTMCVGNEFPAQVKKVLQEKGTRVETLKSNGDRGVRGVRLKK